MTKGREMRKFVCCLALVVSGFLLPEIARAGGLDTYLIHSREVDKGVFFHHRIFRSNGRRTVVQGTEHFLDDNRTVIGRFRTIRFGSHLDTPPAAIYLGNRDYDSGTVDAQIRWIGKRLRELEKK